MLGKAARQAATEQRQKNLARGNLHEAMEVKGLAGASDVRYTYESVCGFISNPASNEAQITASLHIFLLSIDLLG